MTPACWSATLARSLRSLSSWNQSIFWVGDQKSPGAEPRRPPGPRPRAGGGSARTPFVSRKARWERVDGVGRRGLVGDHHSKLLRKLGEAVALTMISLKIVEFGIRTCLPSSVTSTVARVFSDLTRPDCPATSHIADLERPANTQEHRRDEVLGDIPEGEPHGQHDETRNAHDRHHRMG